MERRKALRRIKRRTITFSDGVTENNGTSSNFSILGLFIRTRKPCEPGTTLKMVLEIDPNHKISFEGIVIWSVKTGIADFKNGMGVKLASIPKEY